MNLKNIITATVFLFSLSPVFSQDTKTLDSAAYKIDYPADWSPSYMSAYGAELYIFTPQNDNTEFQENINLMIHKDISENVNDLVSYTESCAASLETYVQGLEVKTKEYNNNDNLSYSILEYSGVVYGEQTSFYQRIYFKNNLFYNLTFIFKPESDISYREKAIQAFDSFEVK